MCYARRPYGEHRELSGGQIYEASARRSMQHSLAMRKQAIGQVPEAWMLAATHKQSGGQL